MRLPIITGAIYQPPKTDLPILAVLFKDGEFLASRVVQTEAEGLALIEHAQRELPLVGAEGGGNA